MQVGSMISLSPSFNSYSNTKLAEIAARVVEEFDSEELYDEFYFEREENSAAGRVEEEGDSVERDRGNDVVTEGDADEDEEFEFAFMTRDSELPSPISADEIFHNGQIRPVYPVFNRDLFLGDVEFRQGNEKENGVQNSGSEKGPTVRLPLRKLFIEERETTMTMTTTSSSSSSEADDLEGVPADTYCVWRPNEAAAEGRCKKSSSTGSHSKRWKFKDLLHRSHSDGSKDRFVLLSASNSGRKKENVERVKATAGSPQKAKPPAPPPPPPPPPALYNRDGGEKRRSYLPYRQDFVGFFANVNGLSKNLQPF
ncbi:uncharacterized protein DDB_G0284459-like [Sesamum indicum]|uniref:Uncharacterized protein DDB_G0284459-like n=1 Tax=Sesamum indicum TaxID=4182 RepID=A0A8M8UWB8_SESIN|nr:uncharacterized protein DDB_G0284459-like [Sesamum indicum]